MASSTDISFLTSPEEGGVRLILPVVLFMLKELAAAGHARHVEASKWVVSLFFAASPGVMVNLGENRIEDLPPFPHLVPRQHTTGKLPGQAVQKHLHHVAGMDLVGGESLLVT